MSTISTEQSHLRHVAQCLIYIDGSEIYKWALQDAISEATRSAARVGELLSRSEVLKNNISQVVGFYLIVQTVLIALVAQSSILEKGNLWSPLVLSIVAAWSCCIPVWLNGMAIAHLQGDMYDEENKYQVAERARSELRRLGTSYTFPADEEPTSTKRSTLVYFKPYALIILFLICFTLIILISQWRILYSANPRVR